MMKSLYSGVSGLKNHNVRMDVIGNNIANVNTTGYKANNFTFRDIFYQTRTYASSGDAVSGGVNPRQVGYGTALGSVGKVMTQSGFTFSDSVYDCAIQGEGFFQVMDAAGNIYYTRNGVFDLDNFGNLVDSNGYVVLGVSGDPTGVGPSSQRITLYVPDVENEYASITKPLKINNEDYEITIRAANFGPEGNIAISIVNSDIPFATMNGNVLTVSMDLTANYGTWGYYQRNPVTNINEFIPVAIQDPEDPAFDAQFIVGTPPVAYEQALQPDATQFEAALNAAIRAGGVNGSWYPLEVEFGTAPLNAAAKQATNYFDFGSVTSAVTGAPAWATGGAGTLVTTSQLNFTAVVPGIDANKYEFNMKVGTLSATGGSNVKATWSNNTLTLTVLEGSNPSLADIQRAIDEAANGRDGRMFTVSSTVIELYTDTAAVPNVSTTRTTVAESSVGSGSGQTTTSITTGAGVTTTTAATVATAVPFPGIAASGGAPAVPGFALSNDPNAAGATSTQGIGERTMRIAMRDGQDSFFASFSKAMSTVVLENGRYAGPQDTTDLDLIFIDSSGVIFGEHPVHKRLLLGRIDVVTFINPSGLQEAGTSYYKESLSSGAPTVKMAESDGAGAIVSGALEMANVDLSQEFSDMIITQRGFQANSRIITVSDTMLEELINLKR